jgi:hypothetical protein
MNGKKIHNKRSRLVAALLALLLLGSGFAGLFTTFTASAQTTGTINEPPAVPHSITVFPSRDFVSAEGYNPANGPVTISVLRRDGAGGYTLISQAQNIMPGADGIAEVNHPGAACWEVITPDIRPGDVVRVTTLSTGVSDQTTVANVTAGMPEQIDATTVRVRGTAQDANGNPLNIDLIEHRLLNPLEFSNDRRTLRASTTEVEDGTLAYDAAGSINWTATYSNLSAADLAKAMDSESRGMWLGNNPAAENELTIFEIGDDVFAGPQAPCTAPLEGAGPPPTPQPVPEAPAYTTLAEPPTTGHEIVAFPERDFVSISGYNSGETVTINVLRPVTTTVDGSPVTTLVTVGASRNITTEDDPETVGFDGMAEVNHPGAAAWEGTTPDIRPGDIVRVTTASGVADQTTVANVVAGRPVRIDATTVEIHGFAMDAAGAPLPIDQLEQRMIGSSGDPFDLSGTRSLRASADGGEQGTLTYDAPGSVNWTATYTNLTADDVTRVLSTESRGMWLGRDPAAGTELTIFEIGNETAGGPQTPLNGAAEPRILITATPTTGLYGTAQSVALVAKTPETTIYYTTDGTTPTTASNVYTAPITVSATTILKFFGVDAVNFTEGRQTSQIFMETYVIDGTAPSAPTAPDMLATSDSGASNIDNLTNDSTPTFVGNVEPNAIVKLFVDGVEAGTANADASGLYSITTATLADGAHNATVKSFDVAGNVSGESAAIAFNIDTVAGAPATPDMTDATDTGTSSTDDVTRLSTPTFTGTAEDGSTVNILVDGVIRGSAVANGGTYNVTTTAMANGIRSVTAQATDAAGNISTASAALSVTVDTTNTGAFANPRGGSYSAALSVTLSSEAGSKIYYTTNGTAPTTASTVYTTAISITATTTLRFFSVDTAGNQSAASQEVYTLAAPAAPGALSADGSIRDRVTLTWLDNSTNETGFIIERSTSATTGFVQVGTVGTNVRTFVDTTVARRTTYYWRVRARNNFGTSNPSNTVTLRTL